MAAFTLYRLIRALRSACVPMTAIIGFSFLLTFIFILYQPTPGPGTIQRLGWQSWEVLSMPSPGTPVDSAVNTDTSTEPIPDGVDWWNYTKPANTIDSASLPLDQWAPLLPHDTGLSEIAITRCLVNPKVAGNLCEPDSTIEQDAIRGKWVRVDRNLNLETGYLSGYLNIYYRRTRRQDINLVDDIILLPQGEEPSPSDGWKRPSLSLRAGVPGQPPLYLWFHLGKTASQMSQEEKANLITELDVLYGEDVPWYGFEKLEPATLSGDRYENTWLTYRRGVKPPPRAPPLHFSKDGKFKVMQIADLHFSVSQGLCRETVDACSDADSRTSTLMSHVLDEEKPDLVVFTGDQLNGQGTSWDPKSVLAKFARSVTDRQIPWAAIFGNHDSEVGATREEQIRMMKALPYSLVDRGPADIHGEGNYVLKVKSADASMTHLLTLYFLDSGDYSKGYWNFWGAFTPTAYDWIRQNQIDWFLRESASISPIERPFTPDTAKDIGDIWARQDMGDQVTPQSHKLAKPNALMFFHMPMPESYTPADTDPRTGHALDLGIHGAEPAGDAKQSDGFFEKGVLGAKESQHVAKGVLSEVKVIGNGHCHLTENCRRIKGVWLCFGGGGSYSGYGKIGFDRRFRIFDISDYGETIKTYKHTEHDEIVDEMTLVGKGAPAISLL